MLTNCDYMIEEEDGSDSDCSDSSSSNSSSSNSSSIGTTGENTSDLLEPAKILTERFNLPKDLCENPAIFNEFFSLDTWSSLPNSVKNHLGNFLPKFTDNVEHEKEITIEHFFNRKITNFNKSPLDEFQRNLEDGNYRPDILKLNKTIAKAQRREQRFQECERISLIAKSVMISREKLLRLAYDAPPGSILRVDRSINSMPKLSSSAAALRAKKRYFQEISTVSEEIGFIGSLSEDENYPEGPPAQLSRKQRRHLSGIQGGAASPGAETRILNTLTNKGSTLDHLVGPGGTASLTEEFYRQILGQHKRRKLEEPDHPELDCYDVKIKEIIARTQLSSGHRRPLPLSKLLNPDLHSKLKNKIKQETAPFAPVSAPHALGTQSIQQHLKYPKSNLPVSQSHLQRAQSSSVIVNNSKNLLQSQLNRSQSLLMIGQVQPNAQIKSNLSSNSESDEEEDFMNHVSKEIKTECKTPELAMLPSTPYSSTSADGMSFNQHNSPIHKNMIANRKRVNNNNNNNFSNLVGSKRNISSPGTPIQSSGNVLLNSTMANNDEDVAILQQAQQQQQQQQHQLNSNINVNVCQSPQALQSVSHLSFNLNSKSNPANIQYMKPATLSDLVGIDMMHLPVDLDETEILDEITKHQNDKTIPELMQETHACFLSLIRDIFCSTPDHRMTLEELRTKVSGWLCNPITPLNDWYHEADGNWLPLLTSAVHFLSGEFLDQPDDFVPYLEFKIQLNIYQWIGASRDSDNRLLPLCQYFMSRKNEMGIVKASSKLAKSDITKHKSFSQNSSMSNDEDDYSQPERPISPPPPRFPTDWTVRKATDEEIILFRDQEKGRYENPHMAFTYRQHFYHSVVGPVKGIYTQVPGISKARGHNMLVADRPNFVTILTLVRDATARLPNGEGTRADICELLKSSQYISPSAPDQVLQTIVSGALDRMHTEHDPCVKYDPKRKIWIYLHRNRTEEEFERLHHQYQGIAKHKKAITRKPKMKTMLTPATTANKISTKTMSDSPNTPSPVKILNKPCAVTSPTSLPVVVLSPSSNQHINQNLPLPALSSLHSHPKSPSSPPPLTNKLTFSSATIQQKIIKPELVPIKIENNNKLLEHIDVEATLDAQTTPIIVKSSNNQNMPALVIDSNNKIQKIVSKNIIQNVLTSANAQKATIPVKVTTSSGLQTVHVSAASNPNTVITGTNKTITSILSNPQNQSILMNQNRSQSPIVAKKMVSTTSKSIIINQSQAPPLVSSSASLTTSTGQSFIIPINLNNDQLTGKVITSIANSKLVRSSMPPALTSTVPTTFKTNSLLHQNKNIVRLPSGKSLINQASLITNINQQQIIQKISSPINSISGGTLQMNQQNIVQLKPVTSNTSTVQQKPNIISTITIPKGQQSTLTAAQQKQILQNIIAQQQKQNLNQKNSNSVIVTQKIQPTTTSGVTGNSLLAQQQQKVPALTLSSTGNVTTSGSQSNIASGTSLINPQIIQIQPSNIINMTRPGGPKIHTLSSTNLTAQQQQTIMQSIKQQQLKNQQQSLIVKSPNLQQKTTIEPSLTSLKAPPLLTVNSGTGTVVSSVSNPTVQTITRMLKPGTSIVQQPQQIIRTTSAGGTSSPLMAKVLTNSGSQLISLESLLQKQGIAPGTTLRVAGTKSGQTQLIQLTGGSGSQITQYAVVSQGRNILSMTQPQRPITTQAGGGNSVHKISDIKANQNMNSTSLIVSNNQQNQAQALSQSQQIKLVHTQPVQSQHNQQITAQQLMNAKIVGVQNMGGANVKSTSGIRNCNFRMVNTSNLNIAHIGGKPVIIASKTGGVHNVQKQMHQSNTGQSQNIVLQGGSNSNNTTSIVIGGQTLKVQGNILTQGNMNILNQSPNTSQTQTLMLGNQFVKVQSVNQIQQVHQQQSQVVSSVVKSNSCNNNTSSGNSGNNTNSIVVQKQPVKVQQQGGVGNISGGQQIVLGAIKGGAKPGAVNQQSQRVVLATQGGQFVTQQILIPSGFQGGAFNIKRLKVIPITHQGKGNGDRSVYTRVLTSLPQQSTKTSISSSTSNIGVNVVSNEGNDTVVVNRNSGGNGNSPASIE